MCQRTADYHRAVDAPHDRELLTCEIAIVHSPIAIGRLGKLVEEIHDRGAIEPRSWFFHRGIMATTLPIHNARFQQKMAGEKSTIEARSLHDCGPIAA